MKKTFNPVVLLVYFIGILVFIMFSQSIFVSSVAFICGFLALVFSEKFLNVLRSFAFYLSIIAVTALLNPLFSHRGQTILFFMNDIPITMESVCYGAYLGTSMANCILWLRLLGRAVSQDDVMALLGRFAPQTSLIVAMSMGFLPKIKRKFSELDFAQRGNGIYTADSRTDKIRFGSALFTTLFGWSVESSISSSLSMKARGYGFSRRSCSRKIKFRVKDFMALIFVVLGFLLLYFFLATGISTQFYPIISKPSTKYFQNGFIVFMLILPFILQLKEVLKWKFYLSKI